MHGLSKTLSDELMAKLRSTLFSINMDEATATNNVRVCSLLVCYFNGVDIVIEHLDSFNAPVVNSATLYHEVMDVFQKREIPVKNLLAKVMDSCVATRGCKTGLHKKLRDGPVPHLSDIDGDLCHHIHNIVQKSLSNFDNYLEKLFRDLYWDFDLSPDLLEQLELLCYHIGVTFCKPPNYVATPWFSVSDICIDFSYLRDVYIVFYSSFVDKKRSQVKKKLELIFEKYNVSKASQESIEEMVKALNKKLSHQMASTENEDCRCSAVQWIKGYSANFNLPVSVTNFQEACHAVLKGQAHDTRAILWSNWLIQSGSVLLHKLRRPGKVCNWEKNSEIEIGSNLLSKRNIFIGRWIT